MKRLQLTCVFYLAFAGTRADAETAVQKASDEIRGCVDRARVEKYISEHNYAELLRGAGSDGRTHAIWTNGRQALIIDYARPADDKMEELKTICVSAVASGVTFNLYVIEKLVSSAASGTSSDKK